MDHLPRAWAEYLEALAIEAPVTRAALRPPQELNIVRAERDLGVALLPELVTWFGLHGVSEDSFGYSILPFCTALDLSSAVSQSVMIRDIWQEDDEDEDLAEDDGEDEEEDEEESRTAGSVVFGWEDEYVLIGADGSGGGMFVDQRPGPDQGCVRWWDKTEADYSEEYVAKSLLQMVTDLTPAVLNRTAIAGWVPEVVEGVLEWRVAERI